MEPLGHHEAHEAVQVLGLLWHWHRQPVCRPVGAAGLGSGSQSLAPAVSQCILFSAAPANHEPEFLQVRDAVEVNEGTSNHEDVEQLMRVEPDVTFARKEAFRDAGSVECGSCDIEASHEH